jgi:hypothetical protein
VEEGEEVWLVTYVLTPGEANVYQEFRTCPEGKVVNISTGNCVKIPTAAVLAACKPDQYRNPLTGRCKKRDTGTALAACADGYERNPETKRCRKIRTNNGAAYAPTPTEFTDNKVFVATGALIATGVLGVLYVGFQFRREIWGWVRKPWRREVA